MANINTGAPVGLDEDGKIVVWRGTSAEDAEWLNLPLSEIRAAADTAATALQPSDVGTAAYLDVETVVLATDHATDINALQSQIDAIEVGGGGGGGTTWYSGTTAPSNVIGADGDFYIDTAAKMFYGPKTLGAWPAGVSMVGTSGSNGKTIHNGSGAPINAVGANGDFYIDTTAWVLFGPKASGVWPASGVSMQSGLTSEDVIAMVSGAYVPVAVFEATTAGLQSQIDQLFALIEGSGAIDYVDSSYLSPEYVQ